MSFQLPANAPIDYSCALTRKAPRQDRTSPQAKPVLHYCGGASRNADCGSPTPNVLAIKASWRRASRFAALRHPKGHTGSLGQDDLVGAIMKFIALRFGEIPAPRR